MNIFWTVNVRQTGNSFLFFISYKKNEGIEKGEKKWKNQFPNNFLYSPKIIHPILYELLLWSLNSNISKGKFVTYILTWNEIEHLS